MSLFSKDKDLIDFLSQKKKKKLINTELEVIDNYVKIINNCFKNNTNNYIINIECSNTINYLFWFLLQYSNNLKLTMFLCDRAILLFNEYINMTVENELLNIDQYNINFKNVKIFVYKKTIGPLDFSHITLSKLSSKVIVISKLVKIIIIYSFKNKDLSVNNNENIKLIDNSLFEYLFSLDNYLVKMILISISDLLENNNYNFKTYNHLVNLIILIIKYISIYKNITKDIIDKLYKNANIFSNILIIKNIDKNILTNHLL